MSVRTPKLIALALTLFAGIALLTFAACGGGDDNASATATGAAHNTNTATSNAGATHTEQATDTPENTGSSDDILSQLQALGGDIQQAKGKVTYTNTDTDGTTSNLTFYSDSPNFRYDSIEADGSSSAYIETPETTYICTSSSGEETCIASPGSGTGSAGLGLFGALFSSNLVDALVAAAQAQGIDVSKSSENIAGTDATCYSGVDNGETQKFCFSDSGVMLAELTTDANGATSGLVATAFSSDVSASDFEPPYPVTTIPGQ